MKIFSITAFIFLIGITINASAQFQFLSPVPGSTDNNFESDIILREGNILNSDVLQRKDLFKINGSVSGMHDFDLVFCRDHKTVLLKPSIPFSDGEEVTVTVHHGLEKENGERVSGYSFNFKITPKLSEEARKQLSDGLARARDEDFGEQENGSGSGEDKFQHGLPPMFISVNNNPAPGDIFFYNENQLGVPTSHRNIITNDGDSIYSAASETRGVDFKINHNGYLTMYEKTKFLFKMYDSSFNNVANYKMQNGYLTDAHDFQIFPDGHCFLQAYSAHIVDMSVYDSSYSTHATVIELVIQELDSDRNVIFSWRSQDHMSVLETPHQNLASLYIDYVHGNSLEQDADGNLIISCRHLDQIDKIDVSTGQFIWRLGGKENQFTFINDPEPFNYQHDARRLPNGDITLFDNGDFHTIPCSYAREYKLDEVNKKAVLVWFFKHHKINGTDVLSNGLGNVQRLDNGNTLINWGLIGPGTDFPNITEVTPGGEVVWEMRIDNTYDDVMYRAHKYIWNPCARPTGYKMKATDITSSSAKLSWSPATGAISYNIQYRLLGTTSWTTKHAQASETFTHLSQLQADTTYEWRMQSVCASGDSSAYSIIQQFTIPPLRVESVDEAFQFNIYPNPAAGQLTVQLPDSLDGTLQVRMINMVGEIIFEKEVESTGIESSLQIPLLNFSPGMYSIQILSEGKTFVSKVMVE